MTADKPRSLRYLIIGDGAAGMAAAARLRQLAPEAHIHIIGDEPNPGYYRAALTNYLIGELRAEQLHATTPGFYKRHRIERSFASVVAVDAAARQVFLADGKVRPYDFLLIASGSRPRTLSFPGAELPGVGGLRTLIDAQRILDGVRRKEIRRAVIVGGGPLALEWAQALREHQVDVTLFLRERRLMPGRLDQVGSDLVLHRIERAGVRVVRDEVQSAQAGPNGRVARVVGQSGEVFAADLLGLGVGVVPNAGFLKGSGVQVEARGIPVSARMETSVVGVYAAGDVALVHGESLGLWAPATQQGRVAAVNMAGEHAEYAAGIHYFATRLFDLDFAFAATREAATAKPSQVLTNVAERGVIDHQRVELYGDKLGAFVLLGERGAHPRARGRLLHRLLCAGADVREVRDQLLAPGFDLAAYVQRALPRPASQDERTSYTASSALVRQIGGASGKSGPRSATPGRPPAQAADAHDALALTTVGLPAPRPATAADGAGPSGPSVVDGAPAAALEVLDVLINGKPTQLRGRSVVLGASDLGISHGPATAAPYAELVYDGGDWYVRDLGSVEGTFVNGERVIVPVALRAGDVVQLAGHIVVFSAPAAAPPRAVAGRARLVLRLLPDEHGPGRDFVLTKMARIGRDPTCEIVLSHTGVSRFHVECVPVGGTQLFVKDLKSRFGTRVDGRPLGEAAEAIAVGQTLRIGDAKLVLALEAT